ncbi:MAG: hypothetical protein FWG82_06235 [Oscillospiraceae bacterium]|nr:hypothetical protein [Oscillospiraceae bacterium]
METTKTKTAVYGAAKGKPPGLWRKAVSVLLALVLTVGIWTIIPLASAQASNPYFPDPNFAAAISELVGKPVVELTPTDVAEVTYLNVGFHNISDLSGIEYFTALEFLSCWSNKLTSLNLQGLTNLKLLNCIYNQLTSLNVQGLTNLRILACDNNQLTSLDVQGLTKLERLLCSGNYFSSPNDITGREDTLLPPLGESIRYYDDELGEWMGRGFTYFPQNEIQTGPAVGGIFAFIISFFQNIWNWILNIFR